MTDVDETFADAAWAPLDVCTQRYSLVRCSWIYKFKKLEKKMKQPKSDFFSRHVNTRQMLDQVASARSSISAIVALIHSFWLLLPRRLDSFFCFCVIWKCLAIGERSAAATGKYLRRCMLRPVMLEQLFFSWSVLKLINLFFYLL